jgi:hypothetical protein
MVSKYLEKPQRVTTFVWPTTSGINDPILSYNELWDIVSAVPTWLEKLRGFQGLKATLCLRLVLAAGPYYAGRVRLAYYPAATQALRKYTAHISDAIPFSQLPGVDLDCNHPISELQIPFKAPQMYHQMTEAPNSWGSARIAVIAPLRTGPDNAQNVSATLWAYMKDVTLYGQTHPDIFLTQSLVEDKIMPTDMETKPISTTLAHTGGALQSLAKIPLLKPYLGIPSWINSALHKTAISLGYSKPEATGMLNRVSVNSTYNAATGDGVVATNPLSLTCDAKLAGIYDLNRTDQDETSINFIKTQNSYWRNFTISTTQTVGTNVYTEFVGPSTFIKDLGDTEGYLTPLAYCSNLFGLYRGAVTYELVFHKTSFHRGSVVVTFQPAVSVVPTLDNSTYLYREVIDFTNDNKFCFTVPFINGYEYLPTGTPFGRLDILIVNPLQSPETVSNVIDVSVYVKAHDSMHFGKPRDNRLTWNSPFVTQSLEESIEMQDLGFVGSSTETKFETGPLLRCMSENVTSILQFAKRFFQVNTTAIGTTEGNFMDFNPWYMYTDSTIASPEKEAAKNDKRLSYFSAPYAFFRGGMQILITNRDANNAVRRAVLVDSPLWINNPLITGLDSDVSTTFCSTTNGGLVAKIPYQNVTRASMVNYTREISISEASPPFTVPKTAVQFNRTATTLVYRSVSDDFQFLFFVGIPRMSRLLP